MLAAIPEVSPVDLGDAWFVLARVARQAGRQPRAGEAADNARQAYEHIEPDSERVDFDGLSVSTVTPETLYRMKKGTVRPKDWGDAQQLARRFGLKE